MWHCHPLRAQILAPDGLTSIKGETWFVRDTARPGTTRQAHGSGAIGATKAAVAASRAADMTVLPFRFTLDSPLCLPKPKHGIHVPQA